MDNSYCDANDVNISFNIYKDDRPKRWETLFKSLVKVRSTSEDFARKCDTFSAGILSYTQRAKKNSPPCQFSSKYSRQMSIKTAHTNSE